MTVGVSTTNIANKWLSVISGDASFTALSNVYVKLHKGDPGSAGASNAAAGDTTRQEITWNTPASGSMTIDTTPSWTNGGTSETLTHISFWDASTAGNFLGSAQLTNSQSWANSNTFTLDACTWTISPLAA